VHHADVFNVYGLHRAGAESSSQMSRHAHNAYLGIRVSILNSTTCSRLRQA